MANAKFRPDQITHQKAEAEAEEEEEEEDDIYSCRCHEAVMLK